MAESILLVSHYFAPHVGGIENVVRDEARHLAALGHDVTVLTTAIGAAAAVERSPGGYSVARVPAWNGVEERSGVPFPVIAPWSIVPIWRLIRAADVVHVHDVLYMTSWLAAGVSMLLRKRVVLTQHVGILDHPKRVVVAVQKLVYATAGRAVVGIAGRVLYLNSGVRTFLERLGADADKLRFLPNGVDTEVFHPADLEAKRCLRDEFGLPVDELLVLFVGRFVPKKGYGTVLDASSSLYRLVFVGGEPSAEDRRRSPSSLFLGSLPSHEVARVYRACDVFVLPSTSEGFPLSVQEAMASGLPVVTSDDVGYDVYGLDRHRVALVHPDSLNVRSVLERIAIDADLRRDMAAYSYELSTSQFSWARHARALEAVYRDALGDGEED